MYFTFGFYDKGLPMPKNKTNTTNNLVAKAKPFIHYMGGKRRLLNTINKRLPKKFNNYYEPFVGGGSLFFDLQHKQSFIADFNEELIITYKTIKSNVEALILDLKKHQYTKEYYISLRNQDRDAATFAKMSNLEKASRFLYLNKTGFNGLYRVNKKGQNNVGYNKKDQVVNYYAENLRLVSANLQNVEIEYSDFNSVKEKVKSGDFIYLDSPYLGSDQNYTKEGFSLEKHIELKKLCDYISSIGAYFLLSNSNNEITRDLYKNYNIEFVDVRQNINPDVDKRNVTKEILVSNYNNSAVNNTDFQTVKVA